MGFSLRCLNPDCRYKFPWDPLQGWPDFCQKCKQGMENERDDVVMPFIRSSARVKAVDQVYRDMEKGSEIRAQQAAELVGASVSDMSALKITDLKDNQRQGDIAAVESEAAMNRIKQFAPKSTIGFAEGGQGFTDGVASGAIKIGDKVYTGIEPAAGARTIQRVQKKMAGLS